VRRLLERACPSRAAIEALTAAATLLDRLEDADPTTCSTSADRRWVQIGSCPSTRLADASSSSSPSPTTFTTTITLKNPSHLGWPIPVLTPVLVLVLVLDGPIASRPPP
jgi:hypothetical protein